MKKKLTGQNFQTQSDKKKREDLIKQLHFALQESEKKYRSLIENIDVGIFRSSPEPDGKFIDVNPALVKILGYNNKHELYAKMVSDIYQHPEDRLHFSEKLIKSGSLHNEELRLVKRDGTSIIVSASAVVTRHENGKILFFDGIIEDITEQKRIEQELIIQKTYFEELFNSAPEAIVLHGNDDLIVNVNDEFTKVFGYTREEVIGKPINDILASENYLEEAVEISDKVIRGERIDIISRRKRKDGSLIDVSILGAPIIHHEKQIGDYAIYRDITESKKAQEARIRIEEETRMAKHIQLQFLPEKDPEIQGYDISGKSIPALNVGGDYYDFIRLDENRLALGIGDVSGKGLGAALIMANLQATIRSHAFFGVSPDKCLENANNLLFHSTDSRTFVSLFYGILDTRSNTLNYANAGQDIPIFITNNTEAKFLVDHGMALGMTENSNYTTNSISIEPGEFIIIYTDGIREAMNSEQKEFGERSIIKIARENCTKRGEKIISKIIQSVKVHMKSSTQNDDMTLVIIKRNESSD